MFIALLSYKVPIEEVEKYIDRHVEYLKKYYASGHFMASGRKLPRTGGVILAKCSDRRAFEQILSEDPFNQNNIANYEIIEFMPTMISEQLKFLMD
ncbi:YciI family protein [Dysgonomonas sp. ZJ279]|uniref:YciI family protein n=1 Tax=Dysgonomonas sp. ZJ279 TaxID=2709796 RepID=UPI0013E9C640|nr:YciI family protein [Dysgonomonas sp. ZJ279]